MPSQPSPVANSSAIDLKKVALPDMNRRELLGGVVAAALLGTTGEVRAEAPEIPAKPTPSTLSEINGMPYGPRFYTPQGQGQTAKPYNGPLEPGGALNVIVMAANKIKGSYEGRVLPQGTELRLRVYDDRNATPIADMLLPEVPIEVTQDTMRRFQNSLAGRLAIGALQEMRVDIRLQPDRRPGNLIFTDAGLRSVRLELVKKPEASAK
jgi:hypothetical protein